jgi:hypothetical protein
MPINKPGQRCQVVILQEICEELGLQEGDFVEVTSAQGVAFIRPKKLVDADEGLSTADSFSHLPQYLRVQMLAHPEPGLGHQVVQNGLHRSDVPFTLAFNQRTQQPDEFKPQTRSDRTPAAFINEQKVGFQLHRQGDRFRFSPIQFQQEQIHQRSITDGSSFQP